jgi:hypothetical protein
MRDVLTALPVLAAVNPATWGNGAEWVAAIASLAAFGVAIGALRTARQAHALAQDAEDAVHDVLPEWILNVHGFEGDRAVYRLRNVGKGPAFGFWTKDVDVRGVADGAVQNWKLECQLGWYIDFCANPGATEVFVADIHHGERCVRLPGHGEVLVPNEDEPGVIFEMRNGIEARTRAKVQAAAAREFVPWWRFWAKDG